ncbi:MAG: YutD family protein [Gammaproteobacteria bacterium]|nr:YutD family protein [Gammaproteobacteria bacterium]
MIETKKGMFEILKDDNNVFVIVDFENKFVDILTKYEYIVGDYSDNKLRLKGFDRKDAKFIPDYINEFCRLDGQYYILRNPNYNKDYKEEEEDNA